MTSLTDYLTFAVVFAAVFAVVFSVVFPIVWHLIHSERHHDEPPVRVVYRTRKAKETKK